MDEYLIQRDTLIKIADNVRALSGVTASLSTDSMTENLDDANEEVNAQYDLLEQALAAIDSKAAGSGGITPEGTITITRNGTHNVTNYALADVALPEVSRGTPSISVSSNGIIRASVAQESGLVDSGTTTVTRKLPTVAGKNITPATSSQTAVSSGYYAIGDIIVDAIPSSYVKPTYTKGTTTYTPSTSNKTISAGTYCSGTQTIKGDANLVPSNIKNGVSIFNVAGTYEGSSGIELPALDNSGSAEDLAAGKTLYDDEGNPIDGKVRTVAADGINATTFSEAFYINDRVRISGTHSDDVLIRSGATSRIFVPASEFGDAQAGYVLEGATFTSSAGLQVTGTIPVASAETYTPTTTDQIILGGRFLNEDQTIKGDPNLVAGNIKSGVSIFGVDGIYDGPENQYKWNKYTVTESVVETEKADLLIASYHLSSPLNYDTVSYSSTYNILNGGIVLSNPVKLAIFGTDVDCSVLIGKYIYLDRNDAYYYIPTDATISIAKRTSGYLNTYMGHEYTVSSAILLTYEASKGSFVSSVTSTDSAAYPADGVQGSNWYVFAGSVSNSNSIKNGSVNISESCSSFTINTGLNKVNGIIVMRTAMPSGVSGTWFWTKSDVGSATNYFHYGSSFNFAYGYKTSKLTDNGSGTITVSQYSSSYPITSGTYNWVAFGS